jgi:6-pyruvoyltetrahydropterin/6-carboxytetrahydropterin synthase
MFEVGIVEQFEAAHRLRGDFGPATRPHGHTYRVELSVSGEKLSEDGTLVDIGALRAALGAVVKELDYQDLDGVASLAGRNTTAEVVARHVLEQVVGAVARAGLTSIAVKVWESPTAFATCSRRLSQ